MRFPLALLLAPLLLAGCGRGDEGPVVVSVIGGPAKIADPDRGPLNEPSRVLLAATAQGLVGFDAAGQVETALAERWIVTDDGRSIIFRLGEWRWADGEKVVAEDVVRELRAANARASRNPLAPMLEPVQEIPAITPEVLEIRLDIARPPMLQLLAQPEMGIVKGKAGTGPFRAAPATAGWTALEPVVDPRLTEEERAEATAPERTLLLRGERAAIAIARFVNRQVDLVLGGSFVDAPLVRAADAAPAQLRVDRALGLFGLSVVEPTGFLADAENRRVLAMAIDREAIIAAFGLTQWQPAETLLPMRFGAASDPAIPLWADLAIGDRRASARARLAQWRSEHPEPIRRLRVAMPEGPGARLLFALVAADWLRLGIQAERVSMDADADLRLIDAVAPADSAIWFLDRLACPTRDSCDPVAVEALEAARAATTLPERAARLTEADAALTNAATFIPIAAPLRWSLVAPRLRAFRENARAVHPLNHLRAPN